MGIYIVLEGPACAGKGTQLKLLKEWLEGEGLAVSTTREPGGPDVAEEIRNQIFKLRGEGVLSKEDEMWMFYGARGYSMDWVEEEFARGVEVVLKDRDYASTRYFQAESGNSEEMLNFYHEKLYVVPGFREPDLRIVLLPSEAELEKRLRGRGAEGDAFDLDLSFALAVRERYARADKDFENTLVIDADGTMEEVALRVKEAVMQRGLGPEGVKRGKERGF